METNVSGGNSNEANKALQGKLFKTEAPVQIRKTATDQLLGDICALINQACERAAQAVNSELVILNWRIGERIRKEILGQERAEYGKRIVATLSRQLTAERGKGFSRDALFRMIQFGERFPDLKTVTALSQYLQQFLSK